MIYSMTGYGRAEGSSGDRQIVVEIKSLNGKQFEIVNRFSPLLKAYESTIRQMLQQALKRGSVDVSITLRQDGTSRPMQVNTDLAQYYFSAMQKIADHLKLDWLEERKQIMPTLMNMPEVVAAETDSLSEKDWEVVQRLIGEASENLVMHRLNEGRTVGDDIGKRIERIEELLGMVLPLEPARISRIRERISGNLEEWIGKEKWDANRLEQELIYYMEKIDFSEEKQRLAAHCDYFKKIMNEADRQGIGKKLGFVLQEIGREINTMGSKANDAEIQKVVVNMKDELEKIKEQVLNIL